VSARELVRRAPEDSSAWTQLGRLLLESGDKDSAKSATKRSLALDPTRSAPWNNLGLMLNREEKWREAVEAFDRALDCDPQNTGAMLNAAESLKKLGKAVEAVQRLRRASEIAPDKFAIWNNLGWLYVELRVRASALDIDSMKPIICGGFTFSDVGSSLSALICKAWRSWQMMPGSGLRLLAAAFFSFHSFCAMAENALGNPREASRSVPRRGSQCRRKKHEAHQEFHHRARARRQERCDLLRR
jgi:tetratricopeptide (TPR) repeat protein